ncbi:Urea ABC transporter, ATP-binding protein UrtE [Thermobacillus xylanilyticus]|uniref:Urea ABC transporter, ATP-binding protein UrtE n=2 Tax=Thermobacillus xylanilyticus TaxID=76633 RepID=A0ABN7RYR6_THEXY|nr:Urea ABC transporter, ATP-binding protein UrtE [Thermobacillus xylanilyticus]
MPMLTVRQLETGYGGTVILRGVSLDVKPGQVVCLLGRNGVGKTTLMRGIMGVLKARKGSIRFKDEELAGRPPAVRARRGIGYVPQGREIFPLLTVYDNLLLGLEAAGGRLKTIPEEAVARFPTLPSLYGRRGGDLSGGQQQQLAFARALAPQPDLLLLDEPCEGIQPSIVEEIRAVIRDIKREGRMAILLAEQDLEFVRSVGDYFYMMDRGMIVWQGEAAELTEDVVQRHLAV